MIIHEWSNMSISEHDVNSLEWWDNYFTHHWEENLGCQQTAFFMSELIRAIPSREREWIREHPKTLVDWGCALGDGLPLLAQAFMPQRLVGIDFSPISLSKARTRYPEYFFYESWEQFRLHYSQAQVVFNSNCLEHFAEPLVILQEGLRNTEYLYFILVPYREQEPLCASHCQIFDKNHFPLVIDDFTLIHQHVIKTDPTYWDGEQLLVVYASKKYLLK